jgi:ribonuclease P protein component
MDWQGVRSVVKITQPLRMNYEFTRIYNKGRFLAGRHVVLHYLRRPGSINRLGVTASRKIKGSVRRNRVKRLLRESYRLLEDRLVPGYDLILVGRDTPDQPNYQIVSQEVGSLLAKAGINRPAERSAKVESLPDQASEKG